MNKSRKFKIGLISILITFGIGVSGWIFYNSPLYQPTKLIIPNDKWEKFYHNSIKETIGLTEWKDLRTKSLPKDGVEIRVWYFPPYGEPNKEAIVFRKTNEIWRAFYLKDEQNQPESEKKSENIHVKPFFGKPTSGWDSFTKEVFDAGLLTISDMLEDKSCDEENYRGYLDPSIFIVEIYKDKTYRTYKQLPVASSKCIEARKMVKVAEIIEKEFQPDFKKCKRNGWLSCQPLNKTNYLR